MENNGNPQNEENLPEQLPAQNKETMSREMAEVQAAIYLAKKFPRDEAHALEKILTTCRRPKLAEAAIYQYSRGGTDIQGPSIRLAEATAQGWGNLQYGIRELEQKDGESTVEAYAWDMENNVRSAKVFQVPHIRDRKKEKGGPVKLTGTRDIYELVANQGTRRMRACILAVIPGDVVEAAVEECEKTMIAKADMTPEALKKWLALFEKRGVTQSMIESRIQRKWSAVTQAQIVNLHKIYNSLKDGMSIVTDWFEDPSNADKLKKAFKEEKKDEGSTDVHPESGS